MERFGHMPVPQIPGVHSPLKHTAVILFGVSHKSGILLGREEIVLGDLSVPMKILISPLLQIFQLLNNLFLTGVRKSKSGRVAIRLFILSKVVETGVAITSPARADSGSTFSKYRSTSSRERFRLYRSSP